MEIQQIIDFAGPIGLLVALCTLLSEVKRALGDMERAQVAQGFAFGLVAVLEMYLPVEPLTGVIVDLRNIPIVLAGAFLGWRGMFTCLAVAGAARLSIGGTGTLAGLFGMLGAGYLGTIWAHLTSGRDHRSVAQLVLLGATMPLTYSGIVFLPGEVAFRFLTDAAASMSIVYLVVVPPAGALLQREIRRIDTERTLRSDVRTCPDTGLLRPASFLRQAAKLGVGGDGGAVAGLLIVTPVYPLWVPRFWGQAAIGRLKAVLALALTDTVFHAEHVGLSRSGKILVPLTKDEASRGDAFVQAVSHRLDGAELRVGPGSGLRIRTRVDIQEIRDQSSLWKVMQALDGFGPCSEETRASCGSTPPCGLPPPAQGWRHPLFAKLDVALANARPTSVRLEK